METFLNESLSHIKINSPSSLGSIIEGKKNQQERKTGRIEKNGLWDRRPKILFWDLSGFEYVTELLFIAVSSHTCKTRNKPNNLIGVIPLHSSAVQAVSALEHFMLKAEAAFSQLSGHLHSVRTHTSFPLPLTLSFRAEPFSQSLSLLDLNKNLTGVPKHKHINKCFSVVTLLIFREHHKEVIKYTPQLRILSATG